MQVEYHMLVKKKEEEIWKDWFQVFEERSKKDLRTLTRIDDDSQISTITNQ